MTEYTLFIHRVSKFSFKFKGNSWNSSTIGSHQSSHGVREDNNNNKKGETESTVLEYVLNFNHTVIQ